MKKKSTNQIKSYLTNHKVKFSSTINLIKAFLLGAEIKIDTDNYLKKTISPTDKIIKFDDFVEWYNSIIPFEFRLGDSIKIKSLDWYNSNKDSKGEIRFENNFVFDDTLSEFCGKEYCIVERSSTLMYNLYKLKCKESNLILNYNFIIDMFEL